VLEHLRLDRPRGQTPDRRWLPLLGKTAFYGSVPGRDEITAGAKGSPGFVLRMMGEAYLAWISAID
jgi:hypothetical protein